MQTKVDKNSILEHNAKYNGALYPKRNAVYVCSGHGCRYQNKFDFDTELFATLQEIFEGVTSPEKERNALGRAIAAIETAAGKKTGTSSDKKSLSFIFGGRKSQMDCVDEATNTTSYLIVLHRYNFIQYHDIEAPRWKGGIFKWTHYAAVIRDVTSNQRWAIDSGVRDNGSEPLIVEYERWYE